MQPLIERELNGRVARIAHSTRADRDLSPSTVPADELNDRRHSLIGHPWHVVRQVHSDRVVEVTRYSTGSPVADALATTEPNVVLAVHSGDCVPVGFVSDAGAVAAAHAGWKGLEAGVLEATVRLLRRASASAITAVVGPHIRAGEYEFSPGDLDRLSSRFDSSVVSTTTAGRPALDLTAAIAHELDRLGVEVAAWSPDCTASNADAYWSHRARQEAGRMALTAWIEDTSD